MDERYYYLGFSVFPGIGPQKFSLLLDHFGSAKTAWEAPISDMKHVTGDKLTEKLDSFRKTFDLEEYIQKLEKKEVGFVTFEDAEYPSLLAQINNPPFVLYVKGDKKILLYAQNDISVGLEKKYVAVVGTRRITSYGKTVTTLFTEYLVQAGCVIVSGLALGVDAIAHRTTVENNGKTIAVLGSGVDNCFPKENQRIYDEIIATGGAIVSEYPLGQEPTIGSFPSRNRIIAGLSEAVLVTEGAEDSGALITADHALEIGRKAFAIPGPITSSLSKGPYKLLKKGGVLVTTPEELIDGLGISSHEVKGTSNKKQVTGETEEEQKILDLLSKEPMMIDQLIKATGFNSSEIGGLLSMMEIKGIVKLHNGLYSL